MAIAVNSDNSEYEPPLQSSFAKSKSGSRVRFADPNSIDKMGTDMQSVIKMIDLLQRLSYEEEERGDKLEERLNKLETAFKTQLN